MQENSNLPIKIENSEISKKMANRKFTLFRQIGKLPRQQFDNLPKKSFAAYSRTALFRFNNFSKLIFFSKKNLTHLTRVKNYKKIGTMQFTVTIPAMIMFFENRYNYLVRTDYMTKSRKIKRAVYYSILYIASISTFITPLMKVPNVTKTRAIARLKYPCLPREIVNNPRLFVLACANTVIICFFTFLFIGWIQVVGFFLATAINIHKGKTLSKKASQMQKQFFIALCIQFSVPLIVVLIPESYLIYSAVTKNLDIALTNISMICFSTHGLFSTIVMLVVHKPYRQATLQILKIKRIEKIGTANKVFLVFQEKKQVSKSMKKSSF